MSENYFNNYTQPADWSKDVKREFGNNDANSANEWLSSMGHEVTHIKQWQFLLKKTYAYLAATGLGYLTVLGKHDKSILEKKGEAVEKKYEKFKSFVERAYDVNLTCFLMFDKSTEEDKIKRIRDWTKKYDDLKTGEAREEFMKGEENKRAAELQREIDSIK